MGVLKQKGVCQREREREKDIDAIWALLISNYCQINGSFDLDQSICQSSYYLTTTQLPCLFQCHFSSQATSANHDDDFIFEDFARLRLKGHDGEDTEAQSCVTGAIVTGSCVTGSCHYSFMCHSRNYYLIMCIICWGTIPV